MSMQRYEDIIAKFSSVHVVVVGDVMLDHFIWGKVSRISPEAPVPVVEVTREDYYPGGAANVVRNLRELGAQVALLSVVGQDEAGDTLRRILDANAVDTSGVIVHPDPDTRRTTVKTRIIAQNQQVVRFDKEVTGTIYPLYQQKLLGSLEQLLGKAHAVIFEDYAKGVLSQSLLDQMLSIASKAGKVTAADPNPRRVLNYHGLTAVTPNRVEAFAAAGLPYAEPADNVLTDEPLLEVGKTLLEKWKPDNLLITLGEHGMCLFRQGKEPHHIPTVAQEVFDVSGAGDTAIATLGLALAAGANPIEAAEISNHAAGVVVGKIGTATCSPEELRESFARNRR